jgi:hypothetical protein
VRFGRNYFWKLQSTSVFKIPLADSVSEKAYSFSAVRLPHLFAKGETITLTQPLATFNWGKIAQAAVNFAPRAAQCTVNA